METIRVDVRKLDGLTNLAGELVNNKSRVENVFSLLKNSLRLIGESLPGSRPARRPRNSASSCARRSGRDEGLMDEAFRVVKEMESLVNEMQVATLDMRLLPVSTIFDAYVRTVRDLKQALGKDVELEVKGREILLDKRILERSTRP